MDVNQNEMIIISLGGSLLVPDHVDTDFIRSFITLTTSCVEDGKRFYIITGGGSVGRKYQRALGELTDATEEELDWIGIQATRLNAKLLHLSFQDLAYEQIMLDPTEQVTTEKPVIIGAGWKPGWSTDYVAVAAAKQMEASTVLNLSNIKYVYDKDPNQHENAKQLERISWEEYRHLLPEEWRPGLHTPFDPVAAREAQSLGITVGILNGQIDNIKNYFEGRSYVGTVIS